MSKSVPLPDWASLHYNPPPSAWVLRRWAREGEIWPAPEKVGHVYYVREDAQRLVVPRASVVDRMQAANERR